MVPADEILPISTREDTLILGDVLLPIAYKGNTVMSPVTVVNEVPGSIRILRGIRFSGLFLTIRTEKSKFTRITD
jgi:hypothetical protein